MLDQPLSERLRAVRDADAGPEPEPERQPASPVELPRRVPLGQLLVDKGAITDAELMLALAQQRQDGRPLGQILLGMGAVTPGDLARTLAEQHGLGFDFSASLRRRLTPIRETTPEYDWAKAEAPEEPQESERYLVRESSDAEPLHVADSFLDAADAAFELIEDRDPVQLEIVRSDGAGLEQLWSYRRDEAGAAPPAA